MTSKASISNPEKRTVPVLTIPVWEFVAMTAGLMALNALAIDSMLPALEQISDHYGVENANDQQMVIFAYILGFGFPQLFYGPLTDRFGRKGLLQLCILGYIGFGIACMFASSFAMLLIFRFLQGAVSSGIRVVSGAVVRDLFEGRQMARILSLVFTIFIIIPIIAPALGTAIMTFAHWSWTFGALGIAGLIMLFWVQFRLPYTLPPENRSPLNLAHIGRSYITVVKTRVCFGYMFASGVIFGALFSFIGASEQIFDEVFHRGDKFWIWFAIVASGIGVASITNAKLVERVGMRRISHSMLLAFIALSLLNLVCMAAWGPNFWIFLPLFTLAFGCFGMMGANFSSLALEPLGEIAGTASAAYGFATNTLSAAIGIIIARQFDGTVIPILTGFFAMGVTSLLIVLWTEQGRLFTVGEGKET